MPRRLLHALLTLGPATIGTITAFVVMAASLVMCSHGCEPSSAVRSFVERARVVLGLGGPS